MARWSVHRAGRLYSEHRTQAAAVRAARRASARTRHVTVRVRRADASVALTHECSRGRCAQTGERAR